MKNWQKERNYRKYKHPDGTVTYIITVEGEDVEVSAEVYEAYSKADRRERYCAEREVGLLLSLERMDEDGVHLSYLTDHCAESAEDVAVKKMLIGQAMSIFSALSSDEQRLIEAVVMGSATEDEYAGAIEVNQSTVHRRKNRILKKMLDLFCIESSFFREGH